MKRARAFHELLPDPGNAQENSGPHSQETVLESASFKIQRAGKVSRGVTGFDGSADERSNDVNHHASDVRQGQVRQDSLLLAAFGAESCDVMACGNS
jgi:hypothetical protein